MRIAVLSDVHSNLEALEAVLADADTRGVDATIVLGDIVGYGADPNAVVATLTARADTTLLAGNHDLAAVGMFDSRWFNPVAAAAIRWTGEVLDTSTIAVLQALDAAGSAHGAAMVHGSVVDPVAEYVTTADVAAESFDAAPFQRCFFGHTHLPTVFCRGEHGDVTGQIVRPDEPITLEGSARYMINPGSVGQPRDSDPRASYLIDDRSTNTVVNHRVAYDIDGAAAKIRAAGLPEMLADRLSMGR